MKRQKRLWTAAAACAVLGAACRTVPGVRFAGLLFWCLTALLIVFAMLEQYKEHAWAKWGKRVLLALVCLGLAAFGYLESLVIRGAHTDGRAEDAQCVVILGAGVNGTTPSLMLSSRLRAALDFIAPDAIVYIDAPNRCAEKAKDISDSLADDLKILREGAFPVAETGDYLLPWKDACEKIADFAVVMADAFSAGRYPLSPRKGGGSFFIVDTLFYIACARCSIVVQNQQKIAVYHRIACRVVVLRLNAYFRLRYFIFCTTKIAVLSFVFFGAPFDFFISIEGRFLRC